MTEEAELLIVDNLEVTINLTEVPRAGESSMLVRMRAQDHIDINKAANRLGFKQSEFLRTVIVNVARKVNAL